MIGECKEIFEDICNTIHPQELYYEPLFIRMKESVVTIYESILNLGVTITSPQDPGFFR